MLEASLREQRAPVSVEQATGARDALPETSQAVIGALVADHGHRARQHLAYQALGEWTPEQREAIRTLAAASPEVRAQVFADSAESTVAFGDGADPTTGVRAGRPASHRASRFGKTLPTPTTVRGTRVRRGDQPRPGDGEAR